MNRMRSYLPLILVVFLLGLVSLFPSFFFTYILQPVAVLFWAAWRILLSVNQSVYWLLLLILCLLLLARVIVPPRKPASNPAYAYKLDPPDRVEYWRAMIEKTQPGGDANMALRDNLEELICSMLALSRHSEPTDLRKMIASGQIPLPPEVKQYLYPPEKNSKVFPGFAWLQAWKQGRRPQDKTSMEEVLRWMENYLEMDHDR